jgi:hypothetical protein
VVVDAEKIMPATKLVENFRPKISGQTFFCVNARNLVLFLSYLLKKQ